MPKFPKKKLAQLLLQACVHHGVEQVVISPGSRNAPLTLGFVNHPDMNTYSIVDERCAGFFALGLAQQTGKTVALLCTSGSALLNYYPAVAEAFYSKIPLLVISADRPRHLIDIGDGQTIRQAGVFSNHILYQADLFCDDRKPETKDMEKILTDNGSRISEALETARLKKGPVHINVPFDEPLYETVDHLYPFEKFLDITPKEPENSLLQETPLDLEDLEKYAKLWNESAKKMVIIGSHGPDPLLQKQMEHVTKDPSVIVLTETTSNVSSDRFINNIDQLIFPIEETEFDRFKPDILLTYGGMVVSKKIKQLLRKYRPVHHWHVDPDRPLDTYHCLTRHFEITPQLFFSQFFFLTEERSSTFQQQWLDLKSLRKGRHEDFLNDLRFSDFKVMDQVLKSLPQGIYLQVGNSSIIRYTQLFDLDPSVKVFCNRGTSGIDGSTSTALGAAVANEEQTVLISGDIGFFYDSNAFWNKYIPDNFRVIVINNAGGGIFKFIPGPKSSDALDYFETPHNLNAEALCSMFGFRYASARNTATLEAELKEFYKPNGKPSLLEIFTPSDINDLVLKDYFKSLDENL